MRGGIFIGLVLILLTQIGLGQSINDDIANAIDIDGFKGFCSNDGAFSTEDCTPDLNAGSNWSVTDSLHNVWFEFTAPQNGAASFTIDIGSGKGNQTRSQAAIWSGVDTSQLNSVRYDASGDDIVIAADSLTPGATYYLSVDAQRASRTGTFTLCFDSILDYDFISAAINIDTLKGTCSPDAEYTTYGASPDGYNASCWAGSSPKANRWFEFTAAQNGFAAFTVDINDTKGDQTRSQVAVYENNGFTQISCNRYSGNTDDVELVTGGLTPGQTYLLSVDVQALSRRGSFTICYDTVPSYDYAEAAIDIDTLKGTCSSDAIYTTVGASADRTKGDCWNNNGPLYNRWFKFVGPTTGEVNITVDIGDTKGTQTRSQAVIFAQDTSTQIVCARYGNNDDDIQISSDSIIPGQTYFLAIDVQSSGRRGTFSLCFDTLVTYDFYERAIDIDTLLGICSADAEYSTIGGSSDMNASSCWGESPLHNRWFKFTAPAGGFADFTIDIGCVKGDQQRTYAAIWGSDGLREVACERYSSDNDDINVNSDTLTPGATYYLSVDVQSTGRVGSFTLCYDTVPDYDYRVAALDIDTLLGSCSADAEYTTIGASGDGDAGDCWNNSGPKLNRWFKFQAPASELVNINIKTGGTEGTINRILAGLWNEDGTEQIACSVYGANGADLEVNADELTEGATYYLAVDAFGRSHDGTFTICIDTTPSYDFYEGALDVTNLFGGCSEDAIYTTAGGTADKLAGDCWNNGGPLFNRWFKFTAPSNGVANITVDRGDGKGTQRRTQLALWGADGEEKIACSRFDEANDDVSLSYTELTPGGLYYISVDAFNINNDGTFTLCLDSNPGYDYIEGAYELTDLNNWCSEDEQFTTAGASPDSLAGSCWNNSGPLYNRWFKFTSLSTDFTVTVDIAGDKGNQRRTQLALWDADDMSSSLECARYTDNADDVTISTTSLEAGKEYFISVDVHSSTRVGTFTLCVSNVAGTYYSRQDGNWDSTATWSATGFGGPSAGTIPGPGDVILIKDAIVTITGTDSVAGVGLNTIGDSTGIIVDGGTFEILGSLDDTSSTDQYSGIRVINNGTLNVSSNLTLNRTGGNEVNEVEIESGSSLTVGGDFIINSSAGTTNNNTVDVSGTLTVIDHFQLNQTASGVASKVTVRGTLVVKDIDFSATEDDKLEIELNSSGLLQVTGDISRGSPAYGTLDCNGSSTIEFIGSSAQTLPGTTGVDNDNFSYQNIIINNTFGSTPQLTMGGPIDFNGTFTFTDGVVSTGGYDFTVGYLKTTPGGNSGSYLDGKMTRVGNSDFTFQVGDGDYWAPVDITDYTGFINEEFSVEYFAEAYSDTTTVGDEIVYVSPVEYWDISQDVGIGEVDVTLHWKDSARSGVDEPADLAVGHYDSGSGDWESYGLFDSQAGAEGSITATGVSDFSPFTFGFKKAPVALPVELISFDAHKVGEDVLLTWQTAAEINNERFEIERSYDGLTFEVISVEFGQGNSNEVTNYVVFDENQNNEMVYYRLKQYDFDGSAFVSDVILFRTGDLKSEGIDVFPNPNSGNLIYFKAIEGTEESAIVNLFNSTGVLVESQVIPFTSNSAYSVVTLEKQPSAGTYFLSISNSAVSSYQKIVFK